MRHLGTSFFSEVAELFSPLPRTYYVVSGKDSYLFVNRGLSSSAVHFPFSFDQILHAILLLSEAVHLALMAQIAQRAPTLANPLKSRAKPDKYIRRTIFRDITMSWYSYDANSVFLSELNELVRVRHL